MTGGDATVPAERPQMSRLNPQAAGRI